MSQLASIRPVAQKTKRYEDPKHLAWVKTQPCVVCGHEGCDPHHLWGVGETRGQKASDLLTFALCRPHHDELHRDVRLWEALHGTQWRFVALTLAQYHARGKR